MFKTADKDNDNLVTGILACRTLVSHCLSCSIYNYNVYKTTNHFIGDEVKNIFMASGVAQSVLAHIWLVDQNYSYIQSAKFEAYL